jgi:hypothetical protein
MIGTGKELALSDKMIIADDLCDSGIESIDFSGGDLLLRDEDVRLVQYAATKLPRENLSISIPGTGLNSRLINSLCSCYNNNQSNCQQEY